MAKVVLKLDIDTSSTKFCSACGTHCQPDVDRKADEALESTFFQCFSSKPELDNEKDSKNIVLQFCTTCKKLLTQWNRITKAVSELIGQANRVKLALAVKILEGSGFTRRPTADGGVQKIKNKKCSDKSLCELEEIKRRIQKEYNCHVVLKNLDMTQSFVQEISKHKGYVIKTEIVDPQTFLDEDIFEEPISPDRPDQLSDDSTGNDNDDYFGANDATKSMSLVGIKSRCESPPRKRPRRTITKSQDVKESDSEIEGSESDQDSKSDRSSSDSETDESIQTTKSPRKLTNEAIKPTKSRIPSFCTIEVGPNEYLYKGEFRFTIGDNGTYYCGHCEGNASSRALIYDHIRRRHAGQGKVPRLINPDMDQISLTEFTFLKKYPFRLDPSLNEYHCGVCDNTFGSKNAVTFHMKDAHLTEDEKSLFHCTQISPNVFLFGGKYKIICDGGRFRCEMCGYNRDTRHGLYFHIRRFHALPELLPAGNSDIPIAEWESMETARDALNVSKSRSEDRNEVDVKVGEYIQKNCVKIGPNEYLYDKRIKVIVRGDKWVCGKCNLSYNTVSKATHHIASRHQKESKCLEWNHLGDGKYSLGEYKVEHDGKLYKCLTCGRVDESRKLIFIHVNQLHANPKSCRVLKDAQQFKYKGVPYSYDASTTKYVCGVCPESLAERNKLRIHIQTCHLDGARSSDAAVAISGSVEAAEAAINVLESFSEDTNAVDLKGEYINKNCVKTGPNAYLYDKRIKVFMKGDKWVCGKCNLSYETVSKATHHISTRHPKESKCLEWDHLGDGKYSLGEYKVEHDGKFYKCLTCGRMDKTRTLIFIHVRSIHANPKPCRELKHAQQFKYKGMAYSYDASLTKYVCGVCPGYVADRNNLRRHIQKCHLTERKKFICDICGLQLLAKRSLKFHRQLHEGTNEFVCAECGKGFKLLKYLKDHQRTHRADDEKKFQCEFCGKKYWTKKEIQNHVTTHTNEKPFPCSYCNLSFANTFQRRKHSKAVHDGLPFQK